MILAVASDPVARQSLWAIANGDPRLKLMFLRHVGGAEFAGFLETWLSDTPPLKGATSAQLKEIFALWFERGDRDRLEAQLTAHAEWTEAGGLWLAEIAAAKKDFKRAYQTAARATVAPALPPRRDQRPASLLERDFLSAAGAAKINFGLSLAYAQLESQRVDEALDTLGKLTALPNCPRYIFYLRAQTLAQKGDWESAWTSWKTFSKPAK
ncbi:MAG: hypothetical protein HY301_13545 [Verrucomicrobia bacterium]|nr:hypothetical protein [Verrucomicrobiota bacterium]